MKGISQTLMIIVTAIVVLVAALIVLSIFGQGIGPMLDITQARNVCIQEASATCQAVHTMPPTWDTATKTYNENGKTVTKTCKNIPGLGSCDCKLEEGTYKLVGCTQSSQ